MSGTAAQRWFGSFMRTLQSHEASAALRSASLQKQLGPWTSALTVSSS